MNLLTRIWQSSLGKKYLMALSGLFLFLFAFGHMVGNLQVFLGAEALNRYAHFLQSNVELLWPVRIVLLGLLVVHVVTAIQLSIENKAARPEAYAVNQPVAASLASRTMLLGGLGVGCFIVYHLLHFTVRTPAVNGVGVDFATLHETLRDGSQRADVYRMVVLGFSNPLASAFYVVGVGLLCLHLSHGISAMFQSLGLKNHAYGPLIDRLAVGLAVILFVGYVAVPLSVLLGLVK